MKTNWRSLNVETYRKTYEEWMRTGENIRNCSDCPENKDGLGCGQQSCWVHLHIKELGEYNQ